jgi:hypothetical protein
MMDKLNETAGSQETQVRNKERTTSDRQMLRLSLGAAVGFLITTIALGYPIGRINSPKWENRKVVGKFVENHYRGRFLAEGREPLSNSDPIELRLRLDDRDLVYRTDTREINEEVLPSEEVQAGRSKDNQTLIQTAFAIGAPLAAPLAKVEVSLRNKIAVVAVAAVAIVGAGGLLGYAMGFDGDPDYSSKPFQEMRSDKARWRQLAEDYRTKTSRAPSRAAPSATP